MHDNQIIKYIKGELNFSDKKMVIDWIRSSPENQKKFSYLKAQFVASSLSEVSDPNSISHYKKFSKKVNIKWKYRFPAIAASALIVILITFSLNHNGGILVKSNHLADEIIADNMVTTITSKGVKSEVVLPDGSIVILNVDSKLTYPKTFNDDIRKVTLHGEAFFDVQHDAKRPFVVDVQEIRIKVLGTTFNVRSYSKDKKIETTLVSGKVELLKDNGTPVILAPSQKAVFYKLEHTLQIEEVNSSNIVAWKEGKLIFKNTSMSDVAIELERKYNKKIIINSNKLLNYEYTGTFDNLNINEVLELLAISSPIKYVIKDEKIILESK
ncbi:FecR family protein [Flavobacteriaceae bacterium LMO-SS05]